MQQIKYIEDICFFEVNTKYISSCELKTSEFSQVRSTSETFMFSTHEKANFLFILYNTRALQAVKMQKLKIFENTNNFGTTLFLTF